MAGFLRLWTRSRSRPATTRPIDFSDEGILNNLTQANLRNVWASRRMMDGEDHLYLVHFQHTAAVGPPITVIVKKFGNVDGMVDSHVKSRWKVERIMLALLQHENIIKILHVIEREEAVMLVYEYAVNGSLHYWLHRREGNHRALSWPERMGIAIGVAQGLCHMHHGCSTPVVHHNITCNNILLDQDLNPKICSFGVGQLNAGLNQPLPIVDLHVGDFGYTAPDYALLGTLTEKVDTYSFGVVLLELVTGRVANGDDCMLAIWARNNCNQLMASKQELFKEVVDMAIPHQAWYMKEMSTVFKLGVACTVVEPEQRPSMLTVLKKLRMGLGKTIQDGLYLDSYISNIGVDFKIHTVEQDGKTMKLQIVSESIREQDGNFNELLIVQGRRCKLMIRIQDSELVRIHDSDLRSLAYSPSVEQTTAGWPPMTGYAGHLS